MARVKGLPAGFRKKKDKNGNETGRLEYRFMIGRERYSVTGSSVGECRRLEQEKRAYIAEHTYIRNDRITVEQYFDEWMKSKEGVVKESTIRTETSEFMSVINRIGKERVASLERRQVVALQAELAEVYKTSGTNHRISLLRSLMKAAIIDGIIVRNPCDGVKPLKRTETLARDSIHRALTLEEQMAFFAAARDEWYYELLAFLVQTGCRIGEAGALKWSDIDYRASVIHIRRTMTLGATGRIIGRDCKTRASVRDIPMTADIRATLKSQREKMESVFHEVVGLDALIFRNTRGGMVSPGGVPFTFNKICREIGIEKLSPHALRDTFATRAIEAGMNPQTLKTIMGHTSLQMTMDLYAHVLPNTKAAEMEKIKIVV